MYMKKLSLLLISVLTSVMSWAEVDPNTGWDYPNPFVCNMKEAMSADGSKVLLSYSLNAPSFNWDVKYDLLNPQDGTGTGRGIQIYLLYKDANGKYQRVPGASAITNGKYSKGTFTIEVPVADKVPEAYRTKDLSWEAVVHGNMGRTIPRLVTSLTSSRPRNAYGIAVNNLQSHSDFGRIYVSEAYKSIVTSHNSFLFYSPLMEYIGRHDESLYSSNKVTEFSNVHNSEPHRVKVSEDGRVFLSSYSPTGTTAVWEFLGAQKFRTVINKDAAINRVGGENEALARRVIGMDLKGKGDNLTLVLAWIDANGYNGNEAKIEIYEYELGRANRDGFAVLAQVVGQDGHGRTSAYAHKIAEYNAKALMCQGFTSGNYSEKFAFVDVAYDAYGNVWMKLDYADTADKTPGKIVWFKKDGTAKKEYTLDETRTDGFYGGSAVLVTKDMAGNDVLFTGTGAGKIQAYEVDAAGSLNKRTDWVVEDNSSSTTTRIGRWVTGLALDQVNNLYALTEAATINENQDFTTNIVTIALPYKGNCYSASQGTFMAQNTNPIPNILATDLRYECKDDKSIFSFYVNTKPKVAQIRFYETKANMLNSVNTVHGDLYDGKNAHKPCFVYNVPASDLKHGKITISLDMCGGQLSGALDSEGCYITNNALPAGEWYWSVYVEAPRRSTQFGVMYYLEGKTDPNDGDQRRYITVNNYPETDMFGSLIVGYNARTTDDATRGNRGLHIHSLSDNGNINDEKADITSTTRYTLRKTYLNKNMSSGMINYPRRLTVAPDGKVFIADEGNYGTGGGATIQYFNRGGVKMWDPENPNKFTLFNDNILGTSTGVSFWKHSSGWKLYAANTYDEFVRHGTSYTGEPSVPGTKDKFDNSNDAFGRNGYVEYDLTDNFASSVSRTQRHFKKGDASGNIGIVAMDKGIWFCQHREHTVAVKLAAKSGSAALADNLDSYILSFLPYGDANKTWTSCTTNGITTKWVLQDGCEFSQKEHSPVQATPGGGIAYRKYKVAGGVQKEYLFIPNHDGNIARLEITGWSGSGTTATPSVPVDKIKIFTTPEYLKTDKPVVTGVTWHTSFITSMEFDYAGNLVTTAGKGNHDAPQSIVIYTMPYPDRVNAQEIQAPNSCGHIVERMSQTYNDHNRVISQYIDGGYRNGKNCSVDFYRPMLTGSYNTICLPFSLNATQLASSPYKGATIMKYTGAEYQQVNEEDMVYLNFEQVSEIVAGEPYLIQLASGKSIKNVERFKDVKVTAPAPEEKTATAITNCPQATAYYQGIFDLKLKSTWHNADGESILPILILLDQNTLGEVAYPGDMKGFRAYFKVDGLPLGTQAAIVAKKDAPTGLYDAAGNAVDIMKYVRDGRVYIRVGDETYTLTGEKVK